MGKPSVYIETSVISYLAARPSRDLVVAANQRVTHDWWALQRQHFELFASALVLDEVVPGDIEAAERRRQLVKTLPFLPRSERSFQLAERLLARCKLPESARVDCLHIAVAACNGMDYLLTWN